MREILFRGKHVNNNGKYVNNGEWVEGDFTNYSEEMGYITVDLIEHKTYQVDRNTVGQFTGLTDKNGVKIFEGDIVRIIGHESPHVVIFEHGYFGLRTILGSPYDQYGKVCPFKDVAPLDIIEVTGNIFDNPDILH